MRDAPCVSMLRTFVAADGTRWSVWCVEPAAFGAESERGPWLVFINEHGGDSRRLFEFPADWATLSSDRLDLLRRIAEPSPNRASVPLTVNDGAESAGPAQRRERARTFTDGEGVLWTVWEVRPSLPDRRRMRERRDAARPQGDRRQSNTPRPLIAVREDLRQGWLAFRSAAEHRRRAPIPDGWSAMSDQELSELVAHAMRFERAHRGG